MASTTNICSRCAQEIQTKTQKVRDQKEHDHPVPTTGFSCQMNPWLTAMHIPPWSMGPMYGMPHHHASYPWVMHGPSMHPAMLQPTFTPSPMVHQANEQHPPQTVSYGPARTGSPARQPILTQPPAPTVIPPVSQYNYYTPLATGYKRKNAC